MHRQPSPGIAHPPAMCEASLASCLSFVQTLQSSWPHIHCRCQCAVHRTRNVAECFSRRQCGGRQHLASQLSGKGRRRPFPVIVRLSGTPRHAPLLFQSVALGWSMGAFEVEGFDRFPGQSENHCLDCFHSSGNACRRLWPRCLTSRCEEVGHCWGREPLPLRGLRYLQQGLSQCRNQGQSPEPRASAQPCHSTAD